MALQDITKKIINDAEAKKKEMMDQARQKKTEILADYKKRVADYRSRSNETADSEGESVKRGIVIDARLKVKNEILRKKRECIDVVMTESLDKFIGSADYPKIIAGLVGKAAISGNEKVVVSKTDKVLNQAWLDGINKTNKTKLTFATAKGAFKGGVILQEGEAYVNITVETLLSVIREDTESEIAKILFKDA